MIVAEHKGGGVGDNRWAEHFARMAKQRVQQTTGDKEMA
jgi:hypothetical protein